MTIMNRRRTKNTENTTRTRVNATETEEIMEYLTQREDKNLNQIISALLTADIARRIAQEAKELQHRLSRLPMLNPPTPAAIQSLKKTLLTAISLQSQNQQSPQGKLNFQLDMLRSALEQINQQTPVSAMNFSLWRTTAESVISQHSQDQTPQA